MKRGSRKTIELTFIGTRGEISIRSRRHRRHSSLLVHYGDTRIMIDCGADWLGRLRAVAPTAIVLTHAHADHAAGLAVGAPCPPDFKVRAQAAYQAPSRAIARELAAGVVADYGRKYDSAVACFMDDFEACIAHLRFPVTHRRAIRSTNLLERLFVEERRRLKIIPNAFGERAVLKLMFGALIRAAERWRSIKVTEFEHRQITAVRKELDQEYEAQVGLKTQLSSVAPVKISGNLRT